MNTTTNFDLSSLHMLRFEFDIALSDAETHLSEFIDDESQAPLLLYSIETLAQVSAVLDLIELDGASDLALDLSHAFQNLYDSGNNNNHDLIFTISEGIMTLGRYIEFVLLKETLEPSLLLPIINELRGMLNKSAIDDDHFRKGNLSNITISSPEKNYKPLSQLAVQPDVPAQLTKAYRAGLTVALNKTSAELTGTEKNRLAAMRTSCEYLAKKLGSLFWQAAVASVTDLHAILPLTNAQKRTLIFLEQQFNNYLPANDSRFADLVSFACQRNNPIAQKIKQYFTARKPDAQHLKHMRRFLFGPNREVTDKVNQLIQNEIISIKDSVDNEARQGGANKSAFIQIAKSLRDLALRLHLLNLNDAAKGVIQQARDVAKWQTPTPQDFDQLLYALLMAENAVIFLAKTHTPGAVSLPINNTKISLHQLDTAYQMLIKESRNSLANAERGITAYLFDATRDSMHIANIPSMLKGVSGAVLFLNIPTGYTLLQRAADYLEKALNEEDFNFTDEKLGQFADVLMAVDYHLESLEQNKPAGQLPMTVGKRSLHHLLAA